MSAREPAAATERREALFALDRFLHHRDGCKCATEAHCASDCTCGMYGARQRLVNAVLASDPDDPSDEPGAMGHDGETNPEPPAAFDLRACVSRWLAERKRLYHEHEWIREVDAQTKTLVSELHARRDGQPARTFNLWAIRGALAEVDHADSEGGL